MAVGNPVTAYKGATSGGLSATIASSSITRTVGDILIVSVGASNQGSSSVLSISDTWGYTWNNQTQGDDGFGYFASQQFYTQATSGSAGTITVTSARFDTVGTTNGSATVTDTSAVATDLGRTILGTGIPGGTTISAVTVGVGFTISQNATATGSVTATILVTADMEMIVEYVTGADYPIVALASAAASYTTTPAIDIGGAPGGSDLVHTAVIGASNTPQPAAPSGYTAGDYQAGASGSQVATAYKNGSASQVSTWSNGLGGQVQWAYALELTASGPPSAPTVSGVSPSTGVITGGTSVVITGTNFTAVTAVAFGATAATSYVVDSSTQITATSPAHTAATVDITVTNTGGTSSTGASDEFTYSGTGVTIVAGAIPIA